MMQNATKLVEAERHELWPGSYAIAKLRLRCKGGGSREVGKCSDSEIVLARGGTLVPQALDAASQARSRVAALPTLRCLVHFASPVPSFYHCEVHLAKRDYNEALDCAKSRALGFVLDRGCAADLCKSFCRSSSRRHGELVR